jgi:CBS-domain-containing membrane protein
MPPTTMQPPAPHDVSVSSVPEAPVSMPSATLGSIAAPGAGDGLRARWRGGGMLPALPGWRVALAGGLGCALAVLAVFLAGRALLAPAVLASLGASCYLAFCVPESPFAQPRSIIGGHLLATAIGLATHALIPEPMFAAALGVALAAITMPLTRTAHPPACSNPIIVAITHASPAMLWQQVLPGTLAVVVVAVLYHGLRGVRYPLYWRGR